MIDRLIKLFATTCLLVAAAAPAAWADGSAQAPLEVVKTAVNKTLDALHSHTKAELASPKYVNQLVSGIILPAVDIDASARLVLGRYWRTATPEQRKAFVEQFKLLLIHTYAKSLTEYADSKVRFLTNRDTVSDPFATVYTQVVRNGQQPLAVDYSLLKTPQGWKVYDITISGLSLVTNYRSTFGQEIAQTSLQALIQRLAKQNAANDKAAAS